MKYTGCDDGWDQFVEYWINEPDMVLNENFFVKVIMDGGMAVGALAIFLEKEKAYIQEFIVSPDRRGMGTGSSILREFLQDGKQIVGHQIENAEACIFPSNLSSKSNKLPGWMGILRIGRTFHNYAIIIMDFVSTHKEGDFDGNIGDQTSKRCSCRNGWSVSSRAAFL